MARDWHHLFVTDGESIEPDALDPGEGEERRRGFFGRLRKSMRKTREALQAEVQATLFEGDLDAGTWERLEEAGVDRVMLQHLQHHDLEIVERIGREIIPEVS